MRIQTIYVTRAEGTPDTDLARTDPASYNVVGGPLRLSFQDVFL